MFFLQVLVIVSFFHCSLAYQTPLLDNENGKKRSDILNQKYADDIKDDIINELYEELQINNITGEIGPVLQQAILIQQMQYQQNRRHFHLQFSLETEKEKLTCFLCSTIANIFRKYRRSSLLKAIVIATCTVIGKFPYDVCMGLFDMNYRAILYIIDKRVNLDGNYACGILLQDRNCYDRVRIPQWSIHVKPKMGKPSDSRLHVFLPLKIIQITDMHIDPLYTPYSNADCDYPICARQNQGPPLRGSIPAGPWGDYRKSDMPWSSFISMLGHIKYEQKNIDYIYFTGDIMPHNVWETSETEVIDISNKFFKLIKAAFGDIPFFPIIGNHDIHPVNLFSPTYVKLKNDTISSQWLYDFFAEVWSPWLPKSTLATIKKGGYYSVVVRPGFRIISLNSNTCYTFNLWLLFDEEDLLKSQLQWLADTLQKAEENSEFVHILGHIPPGDTQCFSPWSKEYHRIILRYSDIIKGQFNGHTHLEEIRFFMDYTGKIIKNVAFNGGSLSTYTDVNPNYRVYVADSKTYDILDYESWIYNISEANMYPDTSPRWFQLYSFKREFGVQSLRPEDMNMFLYDLEANDITLQKYYQFKFKSSASKHIPKLQWDKKNEEICAIVSTEFDRSHYCSSNRKARSSNKN